MIENIVEKGENGYQHFLLFPQRFQSLSVLGCENQGLFGKGLRNNATIAFYWQMRKMLRFLLGNISVQNTEDLLEYRELWPQDKYMLYNLYHLAQKVSTCTFWSVSLEKAIIHEHECKNKFIT